MKTLFECIFSCHFETKTLDLSYLTIDLLSKEIFGYKLIAEIKITMTTTANTMVPAFGLVGLLR